MQVKFLIKSTSLWLGQILMCCIQQSRLCSKYGHILSHFKKKSPRIDVFVKLPGVCCGQVLLLCSMFCDLKKQTIYTSRGAKRVKTGKTVVFPGFWNIEWWQVLWGSHLAWVHALRRWRPWYVLCKYILLCMSLQKIFSICSNLWWVDFLFEETFLYTCVFNFYHAASWIFFISCSV